MLVLHNALRNNYKLHKNKGIRFINSLGPRSTVTADTLGESNLLNVETRVKQLRLNRVYKIFNFVQGQAVITS